MFIKFTICSEIVLETQIYTQNPGKAIRNYILNQYLFKILDLGNQSTGICVRIQSIEVLGNVIMRKSADLKVKIKISLIILKLIPQEYYEGIVNQCNSEGLTITFINGLVQGHLPLINMHQDTVYDLQKNQWIYTPQEGSKGYQWKIGGKIRMKIDKTYFKIDKQIQDNQSFVGGMKDLIKLKANQAGLGPEQWWI